MIDYARLRDRLEQATRGRPDAVMTEVGLDTLDRGLYAMTRDDTTRTIAITAFHRHLDGDRLTKLSDPEAFPPALSTVAPPGACRLMIRQNIADAIDRLTGGYMASRSEPSRRRLEQQWRHVQGILGVDISRDLIEPLGPWIVVHDYPPHPLNIPLAWTVVIQLQNQARFAGALDGMLTAWNSLAAALDEGHDNAESNPWRLTFRQEPDRIWAMHMGIVGPAIAVTDRYAVISWSPAAVRAATAAIPSSTTAASRAITTTP